MNRTPNHGGSLEEIIRRSSGGISNNAAQPNLLWIHPHHGGTACRHCRGNRTALHWFDMAVAGPEIARVLAPGGIPAGLWNLMDDQVEWVAGLARVSGSAAIGPRDTPADWRAETAGMHLPKTGVAARFVSPEQAEFPHGQRRTADSLVAAIATRAGMLVMPEQEQETTLGRIRAFLASRPETAHGEFTLPMLTGVLRVRRL
ncbi:hypothetical protein [Streptomyces roseoverticillatus]|uniref:SAM-dependent methyltransferase n=1 Tax=Streptomyces roseoverticillatus TaxID=66429 RepID=A0ABV3J1M2_9ACTN